MPSSSPAQRRLMEAVAHDPAFAKRAGIAQSVGQEFTAADEGKKKFDDGGAVNVTPTPPQKDAGNYRKGHVRVNGMLLSIESPQGATRSGTDPDGTEWSGEMANHYGYIRGTQGRDKDHLDVFLGPQVGDPKTPVHVIDQMKPDGSFDEHKVLLGFPDQQSAVQAYHANYPDDWKGFGAVSSMPLDTFKQWAYAPGRRVKPASEHSVTSGAGYAQGGSVKGYADGGSTDWTQAVQNFGDLTNLPPDLWQQLQSGQAVAFDGYNVNPDVSFGTGADNVGNNTLNGYIVTPVGSSSDPGVSYVHYAPDGTYGGTQTFNAPGAGDGLWNLAFAAAFGGGLGLDSGAFGASTAGASSAPDYVNGADVMSDTFDANGGFGAGGFSGTGMPPASDLGYINGSDLASDQFTKAGTGDFLGENVPSGVDSWDKAFTNAGGSFDPAFGGGSSAYGYRNGSDIMSDNFDANGGYGAGGFGGGTGAYVPPTGTGGAGTTSASHPLVGTPSLSDLGNLAKLATAIATVLGTNKPGSSSSTSTAPAAPHDYGTPWYMPPGWRSDRPMYVPGRDAVPDGWLGAGGTS